MLLKKIILSLLTLSLFITLPIYAEELSHKVLIDKKLNKIDSIISKKDLKKQLVIYKTLRFRISKIKISNNNDNLDYLYLKIDERYKYTFKQYLLSKNTNLKKNDWGEYFYEGRKLVWSDSATFKVSKSQKLAVDKNNCYHYKNSIVWMKISWCNPLNFEDITFLKRNKYYDSDAVAKSDNMVYFKWDTYYFDKDSWLFLDKNKALIYIYEILPEWTLAERLNNPNKSIQIDFNTLQWAWWDYLKDKNYIYYVQLYSWSLFFRLVKWADLKTFEWSWMSAYDEKNEYLQWILKEEMVY